jgi:ABC-2 type transport system permease protein
MTSRLAMQGLGNLLITLVVVIVGSRMHHISLSAGNYGLVLAVSILGGAVFLSIGQALVGLLKSADSVNAAGRVLVIGLILLGTFARDSLTLLACGGYIVVFAAIGIHWFQWDAR